MPIEILSCEDALRLLADHLDGELESARGRELERHLETCRSCFSRTEFERRLKAKIAGVGQQPVTPTLTRRVQTLIREFNLSGAD